jgi:hypothetical protein
VLAFDFTKKCLFTSKTDQKFVFHLRETHILSQLDISVLYIIFKGLAFDFTEKYIFAMKIGQKSVFHSREVHILFSLDVLELYIIFRVF